MRQSIEILAFQGFGIPMGLSYLLSYFRYRFRGQCQILWQDGFHRSAHRDTGAIQVSAPQILTTIRRTPNRKKTILRYPLSWRWALRVPMGSQS